MALSKVHSFLGFYFENLFNNPIKTKAATSAVIASLGCLTSQVIADQPINPKAIFAYSAFGALVGAPFAHFFYEFIGNIVPDMRGKRIVEFLLERGICAPIFVALSLFFITLFEGKTFDEATANLLKLYKSVLLANWRYLTLPVFMNFNFVPPLLRVFVSNIIGFFWVIYLAERRRRSAPKKKNE